MAQQQIPDLRDALRSGDADLVRAWAATGMSAAQRDDAVLALSDVDAAHLVALADQPLLLELAAALRPATAARLLEFADVEVAADVLEELPPDKAADIAQASSTEHFPGVLIAMEPVEAAELEALMGWAPDTAGGRMTPAFVAIAPEVRADEAVVALRRVAAEVEAISDVYVTAPDDVLLGVLPLRDVVLSPAETPVADLLRTDIVSVSPFDDQEDAARLLTEHDLAAVPVVYDGRILGVITADDVADILEEEATEDFHRIGGSEPLEVPYLQASPGLLWRRRIVWLLVLFIAEAYTGTVLRHFQADLEAVVALAFFVPLLIGTGGNVGSQIVTTVVRAMAVGEVGLRHVGRIVRKELITGVMLAAAIAAVAFARAWILGVGFDVASVVMTAIAAIVVWASLVGAILPLLLKRLRIDPAVVSAPFITTLVDGTGLLIYFWIARAIL